MACQHFVKDCTQQIDVAATSNLFRWPCPQLRSHISRSTSTNRGGWRRKLRFARIRGRNRKSPVKHDHFTELTQHDVFGFQVAIDHTVMMSVRDGVGNFQQNFKVLFNRLCLDDLIPWRSFHLLHGIERRSVCGLTEVMNRDDVGMNKVGRNQSFRKEHLATMPRHLTHLDV